MVITFRYLVKQLAWCCLTYRHHGLDVNFTDVFDGDLHVHYYHSYWCKQPVGNNLDTYGFDWTRDHEEWDFYVQYAARWRSNAAIDYDGEFVEVWLLVMM